MLDDVLVCINVSGLRASALAKMDLAHRGPHKDGGVGVCTEEDVEAFFASPRVVDLYADVVRPRTEWPLSSYGLKPIAKSCGFSWKAEDASGASSIAWYAEYLDSGDAAVRERSSTTTARTSSPPRWCWMR